MEEFLKSISAIIFGILIFSGMVNIVFMLYFREKEKFVDRLHVKMQRGSVDGEG